MIVKIIGGAPFAISIILTIFMGGLGLGAWLASRAIDKVTDSRRLIRIYGILELIIGGCGLVLPFIIAASHPLWSLIYNQVFSYFMLYNLLTFVGCTILLIIPVTCMGATLPVLCRFYVTSLSHIGTHAGRLYGLNTIGAAVGALLAGFVLLYSMGMWGTLAVAVVANAAIGIACLRVGAPTSKQTPEPLPQTSSAEEEPPAGGLARPVVYGALIIFAVSGFCSMSYEVIWTKLLALLVGPTTYSFTIVLATFITSLALGSMFFGWLVDRVGKPALLLVITQIAAAITALAVSHILGNSQLFFAKLISNVNDNFLLLSALKAVSMFVFMFVPTFCLGATFPLVAKIYTRSAARVGKSIGVAYAINTIGAVLGSFVAGFVIVPAVGKATGLSLVVALQLVSIVVFVAILISSRTHRKWQLAVALVLSLVAITFCFEFPTWNRYLFAIGKYHRLRAAGIEPENYGWWQTLLHGSSILAPFEKQEVIYFGDGIAGTTTVLKDIDAMGNVELSMANAGKPEASTRGDMVTQTLLAHFPMLFHPDAKSVMVLGLASGVTAGEILHYPVERLDAVEISGEVIKASDFFTDWNNHVLEDPRTNLILQDGRAHLGLTDQKYDVVTSEPSNPWMAGLATLFTRDFFTYAFDHLNDGGIFVQFIHTYQMDWPTFALVGRTFYDVFPNSILVATSPSKSSNDYMLIGFKGDRRLDIGTANKNLAYMQKSSNARLSDARLLYKLIRSEDLPALFGSGPLNSDTRPRLEFAAPKLMHQVDPVLNQNISLRAKFSEETQQIISEIDSDVNAQLEFADYALSVHYPLQAVFSTLIDIDKATPSQRSRYYEMLGQYCANNPVVLSALEDDSSRQYCAAGQIQSLQQRVDSSVTLDKTYSYLGWLYYRQNQFDRAVDTYKRWLKIKPDDADIHMRLAQILVDQGAFSEAIGHFRAARRGDPNNFSINFRLADALARTGDLVSADTHFRKTLDINPNSAEAHAAYASALTALGRYDDAISHYEAALRIKPDLEQARIRLNQLLARRGSFER